MSDKPILFLAPMVRALLAGTKTQTRRTLKPQPVAAVTGFQKVFADHPYFEATVNGAPLGAAFPAGHGLLSAYPPLRYAIGDRLYVCEHWRTGGQHDHLAPRDLPPEWALPIEYLADGTDHRNGRFRQGMHMPRWASRITLTVTDVQVTRLQEISEGDALAEGVPNNDDYPGSFAKEYCSQCGGSGVYGAVGAGYGATEVDCAECATPELRYRNLWDHINGPGSWDANPWVAAYTFTVQLGNIDQVAA